MTGFEQGNPGSLEELVVSTLAMTDAVAKLLIEKGVITDAEFKQKLLEERAVYQRILNSNNAIILAGLEAERRRQSRAGNVRLAGRKSGTRLRGISGVSLPERWRLAKECLTRLVAEDLAPAVPQ
jgi:hypothetical protein